MRSPSCSGHWPPACGHCRDWRCTANAGAIWSGQGNIGPSTPHSTAKLAGSNRWWRHSALVHAARVESRKCTSFGVVIAFYLKANWAFSPAEVQILVAITTSERSTERTKGLGWVGAGRPQALPIAQPCFSRPPRVLNPRSAGSASERARLVADRK